MSSQIQNNNISAFSLLKKVGSHLDNKRKKQIKFVLFLSILSSIAESVSIALLVPFISFFINPDNYLFNSLFKTFFKYLNITSEKDILTSVAIFFSLIVLLSSFIKLTHIKLSNTLTDSITSDFRIKIFKFFTDQDYSYHFKHGSNVIMSNLLQKSGSFTTVVFSSINILNATLISLAVMIVLIVNEPFYTPIIIISIIFFFTIIFKIKSKSILQKGQTVSTNQNYMVDIFQNAIGYLPEIIIYNIRNFVVTTLKKYSEQTAKSAADVRTIAMTPRIYLEAFVIILVISLIYFTDLNEKSIEYNISYLAILAFGTQKCLPLINSVYNLSISFKNSVPIVSGFLKVLEEGKQPKQEDKEVERLEYKKSIKLSNITFQYDKNLPNIINKFSFEINKGEKIAIKGKTGSGKSTLANIISGLVNPTEGKVLIDDILIDSNNLKGWQKNIAIVPQAIFLSDTSIMENIALSFDKKDININKVKNSAKTAQIDEFIESLLNKYDENVGERGIRLSGGQRQRIGIARAIYKDTNIIILDEPTNALDNKTEKLIMDSILNLSKDITLIMISHSDTSLKFFDKIIDLDKHK